MLEQEKKKKQNSYRSYFSGRKSIETQKKDEQDVEGAKGERGARGQQRTTVRWKRQRKRRGEQEGDFQEADPGGAVETGGEMEHKGMGTLKD